MAQIAPPIPTPAKRESPTPVNSAAGVKRKRVVEKKFYAVKEGKKPGIYDTWNECLEQVRGHKGALFKAFQSLHEAQAFVEGKLLAQPSKQSTEQKFYAVQNGKVPGVYTDWPSAQAQIRGIRNPKHKKFSTRAEAEAFVAAGKKNQQGRGEEQNLTPEEEIRRLIVRNSAPGMVLNGTYAPKDKSGDVYEPGRGPLPPGAEDGFDPNIKLPEDGALRDKTEEEKDRVKYMTREKEPPGMLRIYTDGSSLKNGQAGARAGVGVYFGPQDPKYAIPSTSTVYTVDWVARGAPPPPRRRKLTWRHRNISEALRGTKQTNQRAELTAIQRALSIAPLHRDVTIYTDSRYSIDCVTNWYKNWEKNGWHNAKGKPVENRDLVMDIRERIVERDELERKTFFVWVKGHANDTGNIAADKLATQGAAMARGINGEVAAAEEHARAEEEASEDASASEEVKSGEEDELEDAFNNMAGAMSEKDEQEDHTGDKGLVQEGFAATNGGGMRAADSLGSTIPFTDL